MTDVGTKALDYARMVALKTDWTEESPVLRYNGWTVYSTDKIDFRIIVTMPADMVGGLTGVAVVMGVQTWAVLSACGFETCLETVTRTGMPQSLDLGPEVQILPWAHAGLREGMRRLGWVERDPLEQLVDDANRLLRVVGGDETEAPKGWWQERATEYARIREMRDGYAQSMARLDSLLQLAEDKIADVA